MRLISTVLITFVLCLSGCGDHRDPNIKTEDIFKIMEAISDHPIIEKYPISELGGKYDKGDHWLVEIRKKGTKKPSTWLTVDKATKAVKVVD